MLLTTTPLDPDSTHGAASLADQTDLFDLVGLYLTLGHTFFSLLDVYFVGSLINVGQNTNKIAHFHNQGSHKRLETKIHDFSMTFHDQISDFP